MDLFLQVLDLILRDKVKNLHRSLPLLTDMSHQSVA
jgi:hypothetical protein